jgi:Phytanoyl-CoA dioxygenase (PhyH)
MRIARRRARGHDSTSMQRQTGTGISKVGFAILPRLVGRAELHELQAQVDRVLAQPLPPVCSRPHNTLAPLRWDSPLVARMLADDRRVRAVAAAAAAGDLRWISAYVSVKDPRSEALEWHQDWWCWDHPVSFRREAPQVALLCYLSPTTTTTAALRVVPGSHHRAMPAAEAPPDAKTLALNAGDAVLIDYRLLHGTHPNAGHVRRDCVILNFAPAWRFLPADVRAHLIRHPALPGSGETDVRPRYPMGLLPDFAGEPHDLPLSRVPPASFAI